MAEVAGQGILVRDLARGPAGFPAYRQGHEAYLCWFRGEERTSFWHKADLGYCGRNRL